MPLTGRSGSFAVADSLNHYLLAFESCEIIADVKSFEGRESLSQPYRFIIRFTSSVQDIPPEKVMMQPAVFMMRACSTACSLFRPAEDCWHTLRKIYGVITRLSHITRGAIG